MDSNLEYKKVSTPVGTMVLVADQKHLVRCQWDEKDLTKGLSPSSSNSVLNRAEKQLKAYFNGKLRKFDLPLKPVGTEFQKAVWKELSRIGYGEFISYGEQAKRIGNPKAVRAVGGANGRNPIAIIVPCHRVIGASGSLTGFGGGLKAKEFLLRHEGVKL